MKKSLFVIAIIGAALILGLGETTRLLAAPGAGEITISAYTSGYSYFDNTPPSSAGISNPVLHTKAGGTGTYSDPATVAVGHSLASGSDVLDYPQGTKFYIPNLRRYFIVEDTCGDGTKPQNGPCHTGFPPGTTTWLDLWIDGASGNPSSVQACTEALTNSNGDAHTVIENPTSNYLVVPGSVFQNGACSPMYGNKAITISAPATSRVIAPTVPKVTKQPAPTGTVKAAATQAVSAKAAGANKRISQNAATQAKNNPGASLALGLIVVALVIGLIINRRLIGNVH